MMKARTIKYIEKRVGGLTLNQYLIVLFSIVSLCILIEPAYINHIESLHQLFRPLKMFICILVVTIFLIRRIKINFLLFGIVAFNILLFLSTMINSAAYYQCLRIGLYTVTVVLLMQIVLDISPKLLLDSLSFLLGIYVHINLLTRVMYPNGLYITQIEHYKNCWFLGYDNLSVLVFILAAEVCLFRILSHQARNKLWDVSVLLSMVVFSVIQEIATAILIGVVFLVFMLLSRKDTFRKSVLNAKIVVIGMFTFFGLLQLLNVQEAGVFSWIFSALGKNATLSGRTWLWSRVWKEILNSGLFMGRGVHDIVEYVEHFGRLFASHMHSYYLQILYEGGLVTFICLAIILFNIAAKFDKSEHTYPSMAFLGGFLSLLLLWQVEAYSTIIFFSVISFFLLYHVATFEQLTVEVNNVPKKRFVF